MKKKVLLAFSGGLDTSYCAMHLVKECGFEVVAATINTGGFDQTAANQLQEKALSLGVSDYKFIDQTAHFYEQGIKYLIFGNVLKNNTYPLSVSAERVFQAMALAYLAIEMKVDAIAHGSTGAGNDQIRFDLIFQTMCPHIEIITPIRDLALSREEEISYLQQHGVEGVWEKARYSINEGLWGTSIGGMETLTSNGVLPEEAFPNQLQEVDAEVIAIRFQKGEPVGLNGTIMTPIDVIKHLNEWGGKYAIGRDVHVGDTIIGIKGRVGFEAAGPLMLIKGHHLLEKHTLSKQQLFIKDQMTAFYGSLMHEGQYLDPVMRNIEAFLSSSQKNVTGTVEIRLAPYRFQLLGIQSDFDLMQSAVANYGETNKAWSAAEVKGFTKIFSNQTKLYYGLKDA
ncbi:argininosuccinate synthase [Cyclobacteriaceae bacterium]|jgi:argininosuccinate synthase|nr:argininosuccinate synthase [Cyclobacteriaceae bacterium]|tara:strand:+ start:4182 stop:5369 length:1188 start_codon:yes stop_codon:yes gene_type:complete